MGYARYGKSGKGLSDKAQKAYNRRKKLRTHKTISLIGTSYLSEYYTATEQAALGIDIKTYGTSGHGLAQLEQMRASGIYIPPGTTSIIKSRQKQAAQRAHAPVGQQIRGYGQSIHRGMPTFLQELLAKHGKYPTEDTEAAGGAAGIGSLIGLGVVGYIGYKMLI